MSTGTFEAKAKSRTRPQFPAEQLRSTAAFLIVLCFAASFLLVGREAAAATTTIPPKTDDGLDPVNLVFTGYAPAWWVLQNLNGWNPTSCSEPKTLSGKTYDFTLETPDTTGQIPPCYGPRFHIRVWDMGLDPVLGHWSVGAVHHENSVCQPFPFCRHVIDGWENAEQKARSTLAQSRATVSVSNYRLPNNGDFQNYYNDGNATLIQLSRPSTYPVRLTETGLKPGTSWTVTLNQTTLSSTSENIIFSEPNGTYTFTVAPISGYTNLPMSAMLQVSGDPIFQPVRFAPLEYYVRFSESGLALGTTWSVILDGIAQESTGESMTFQVSKGTHLFSVTNPPGYTSNSSGGSLVVNSNATVRVSYDAIFKSASSLPRTTFFIYTTIAAWAIVGLAVIITVARRPRLGRGDDRTISE